MVSTRFGVVQKNKIRPIDNFRASHVNAACGTSEKVLVDGPDLIAQACLQLLAQTAPSKGKDRLVGRTWISRALINSSPCEPIITDSRGSQYKIRPPKACA